MSRTAPAFGLADTFDPLALNLVARHSPGAFRATFGADAARQYPGMPLKAAVDQVSAKSGLSVTATMTSADFAQIITETAHVAGILGYDMTRPEILRASHETRDIPDFKLVARVRGSLFPQLLETPEGAEVQYGSLGGSREAYQAIRYSRLLELTEQAIVNDDLGLLVGPALRIGEATADLKASVIADRIASNPAMSDGKTVFHLDHGNVAPAGTALDLAGLSMARTAMRRQKQGDGERPMNVEPAFLVVPPELETAAEQLVTTISASRSDEVNVFAGRLAVIAEPRLTDPNAWYLFARPERQLGLEHGGVNGTQDPEIRSEARLERHSVVTRVTVDFACGWIDWRGAYRNAGI